MSTGIYRATTSSSVRPVTVLVAIHSHSDQVIQKEGEGRKKKSFICPSIHSWGREYALRVGHFLHTRLVINLRCRPINRFVRPLHAIMVIGNNQTEFAAQEMTERSTTTFKGDHISPPSICSISHFQVEK